MSVIGTLKIHCFLAYSYKPVDNVKVKIFNCDRTLNTLDEIKEVTTNAEGYVTGIKLDLPDSCTSDVKDVLPYGLYTLKFSKEGYRDIIIRGVQVFPNRLSIQRCYLEKGSENYPCNTNTIVIQEHKQVKQQCSRIASANKGTVKLSKEGSIEEKKCKKCKSSKRDKNMRVLDSVEVPSVITVHCGSPTNSSAPNYTVSFVDYVKNCASSELYSTWNSDCLRANVYCIVSFALNRVYTEWYRSQGYDFDITNDVAYDQSFVYGRTTYNSINVIVDQLFTNYLQRPNEPGPFLSQYCNGTTSTCPGELSQWGSEYLGQNGYTPYEILTYYYGNNLNILTADVVNGYPTSYPGYPLGLWTEGSNVEVIQNQLNVIGNSYPSIPQLAVDGIYGPKTENSVTVFQGIFDLPTTGIVNQATWYSISRVYVGVTDIAN